MIIKFQDCSVEEFNKILLKWKQTEINLINKYKSVPYVSILASRKIIILHDFVAIRSMIELLIESSFFGVVCSIVYVERNYKGGSGGILIDGEEDPVFSVNKYHYEIINSKEKIFFKSSLFGIDTMDSSVVFNSVFQLKLIVWDLLFSMGNIGKILEVPVFFERTNNLHFNVNMIEDLFASVHSFDEELWNEGETTRFELIFESCYNGSLIDFIFKNEVTDAEFGFVYPNHIINELFSSSIRYGINHSKKINDYYLNSSILEISKSTLIRTKNGIEYLNNIFFQVNTNFKNSQSNIVLQTTNFSVEEIWTMINNPLIEDLKKIKKFINVPAHKSYILFIDCETTSIQEYDYPPRLVSLSWALTTFDGVLIDANDLLIKPVGFYIDENSTRVHGVSNEKACEFGVLLDDAKWIFETIVNHYAVAAVVGHNLAFDIDVLKGEKFGEIEQLENSCDFVCTMKCATKFLQEFESKWPRLNELFYFYFKRYPHSSHNSLQDVHSTMLIYFKMVEMGLLPKFSNDNDTTNTG